MKGKVEKEKVHLIQLKGVGVAWRKTVHAGNLISDRGSPCSVGTFLPFIRKTKVPLADGQEKPF